MTLRVQYGERLTVIQLRHVKNQGLVRIESDHSARRERKVDAEDFDYIFSKATSIADKSADVGDCGRATTTLQLVEDRKPAKTRTTRACLRTNTESSAATRHLIDLLATYVGA